jgi:predicted methyltransferase
MKSLRATELAHAALEAVLRPGDVAIDATVGNGHDTAFLAACVGPTGRVYAFDVQPVALAKAQASVGALAQVRWVAAGHQDLDTHVPRDVPVRAAMFNLGYLPGADRSIVTRPETTLAALHHILDRLTPGGRVTLVLYTGHEGGRAEAEAVHAAVRALPRHFVSGHFQRLATQSPAPELVVVPRKT